jgi:hypothetical protein
MCREVDGCEASIFISSRTGCLRRARLGLAFGIGAALLLVKLLLCISCYAAAPAAASAATAADVAAAALPAALGTAAFFWLQEARRQRDKRWHVRPGRHKVCSHLENR